MKCIFIYNPVGGRGKIAAHKEYIVNELKEKYDVVDTYATQCAGDMTRIAREVANDYDAIIFAGGDGSFNELLQGIGDMETLPVLGYIPSGTVNDVAHSLRIPVKLKKALKVIKTGVVEQIDCMKLNDQYAVYVATTGAFTSATYTTPQKDKNNIGRIAYGFEGIKHNLKFQPFEVVCRGEEGEVKKECILIAFINSKYVAGMRMNPLADLRDGEMEVAIVERKIKAGFFRRLGAYFTLAGLFVFGYRAKLNNVIHLKGRAFDVELDDDITWNIDGERGIKGNIHIEVLPRKVSIIVPAPKAKKK